MLEETKQVDFQAFLDADEFQMLDFIVSFGGDPATDWFADAVQHFIRYKYARTTGANQNGMPVEN